MQNFPDKCFVRKSRLNFQPSEYCVGDWDVDGAQKIWQVNKCSTNNNYNNYHTHLHSVERVLFKLSALTSQSLKDHKNKGISDAKGLFNDGFSMNRQAYK